MKRVAHEIRDLPNVLGFDTLNEPSQGWACEEHLLDVNCWPAPMGWSLTGWDAFVLGQDVRSPYVVFEREAREF